MSSSVLATATPAHPVRIPGRRDWNLLLLGVNVGLVVLSYWLAGLLGMGINAVTKPLRIVVLAGSLGYLLFMSRGARFYFRGANSWRFWLFMVLNLLVLPFSYDFYTSFEKLFNLIPYLFYLNYVTVYLLRNFTPSELLIRLLDVFNIVYAFPVATFFLFGVGLAATNIYGEIIGGFVNNHYGWASSLFLATSWDLYRNKPDMSKLRRWATLLLCPLALFLLAVSGSRSSYVSFALCFLIFVVRNANTNIILKGLTVVLVAVFVLWLYQDKTSALSQRMEKTETQLKKGEARFKMAKVCWDKMMEHPQIILTGYGFYAYGQAVLELDGLEALEEVKVGLHNSYYDLFFGCGWVVMLFFLVAYVLPTLITFFVRHSGRFIFLPPLMLIPFFESNFNPGQFLFFPWFIIMFYYAFRGERQVEINPPAPGSG